MTAARVIHYNIGLENFELLKRDSMKLYRFILPIALVMGVTTSTVKAQYGEVPEPPEAQAQGFQSITADQAEQWINILAGPQFSGRGTGQDGYIKAAHWVAGKVAEFGLEPVGDGGTYFQMMPITLRTPEIEACKITGPNGFALPADGNLGFQRYTDQGQTNGEIVFLFLEGEEPRLPADAELREKIVIYQTDEAASAQAPRLIARQRPAATFRIIDATPTSKPQTLFPGRRSRSLSVSGSISEAAAREIAESAGVDPFQGEGTRQVSTNQAFELVMQLREEPAGAPNVVAWLEGSDPELKDEYIVIGSHLDHLGDVSGRVHPGADDNGSGSTAVLSIARAMALNPVKPKRSVLFIWFTAEEVGLLGSRYYTDNPMIPLDKMMCMFNIDMVGRNEDQGEGDADADNEGHIHLIGSQRGNTDLHDLVLEANKYVGFEFELDMESVWNRSDQVNFYRHGVPVAFLFGGFHPDYHQTSDTPDKINVKKIASAARLYYMAIFSAADHGPFEMQTEGEE